MSEPKVYELKASDDEMQLWHDAETRKLIIAGGIEQAKDAGCRLLCVLDTDGNQLHLEGFGPRLWDVVSRTHDKLDDLQDEMTQGIRALHALVQHALREFDAGDVPAAHTAIRDAMFLERKLFGTCECSGSADLLSELGYSQPEDFLDPVVENPCDVCGKEGQAYGHVTLNVICCSRECVDKAMRRHRNGTGPS